MRMFINNFHFVMAFPLLLLNVGGLATGVCQLHSRGPVNNNLKYRVHSNDLSACVLHLPVEL